MGLIPWREITPLLACPSCHALLEGEPGSLGCANPSCRLAGRPFQQEGAWPILIDFSNSIVQRESLHAASAASPIPRIHTPGLKQQLVQLLFPDPPIIAASIRQLVRLTKEDGRTPTILIIGGGTVGMGMQQVYSDPELRLVAFDIYGSPTVQFIADAHRIPLRDASVDAVVIQVVLEHVLDPAQVVTEIHRVLRPGGLVYSEIPFMQPVHEGPYDFMRLSESGHRYLFKRFDRIDSGVAGGPGWYAAWTIAYVFRGLLRSPRAGFFVSASLFWVRYLDRLIPEPYAVDSAAWTYFLGRRQEAEVSPADMVPYYRGAQRHGRP